MKLARRDPANLREGKEERHRNVKYIVTYTSVTCTIVWLADELGVSPTQTKTVHYLIAPRHSNRLRSATGQSQLRYTGQDQDRSKTLSKQLYSRNARATRTARCTRTQTRTGEKSALKARHKRKNKQKARYARRDAKTMMIRLGANSGLSTEDGQQSRTTNVNEKKLATFISKPQ